MDFQLDGLTTPSDPAVSPDGANVAFVVSTVDLEGDRYMRTVWMADAGGVRPFTAGPGDSAPRFSPDGSRLAFLRAGEKGPAQLAVMPTGGGEATVVTDLALGVGGEPVWSPDGNVIAIVGTEWAPEWADLDDDERARRPRVIRERNYRADGLGWRHDRRSRVYLVDPNGESPPRRLTTIDRDESAPAWSPDSRHVAFLSDVSPDPGYSPGVAVFEASVDDDEVRALAVPGQWANVTYRTDGVVHLLGSPGASFPEPAALWRLEPEPTLVNTGHDRSLLSVGSSPSRLVWEPDGAVLAAVVDSGAGGVVRITPHGLVETVRLGEAMVTGFDRAGDTLAAIVSTIDSPGRLEVDTGATKTVWDDFGGTVPPTISPEHFVMDGPGSDLDVWVYLPEGSHSVPLLLNIHGGPASQYGWGFFDEFQVYAGAGYGVVATNPRGSAGRDGEFLRAVTGHGWGAVDVADIDAVVAAVLERFDRLDGTRLGVMGGSYGGFLTAWLVAHQKHWTTAIVERALLSWPSFAGTSDIGGWFGERYVGGVDLQWDRSPLRVAHQTSTPTLVIHSEDDFRCPIEQAEQYFSILRRSGVTTEFVRFPGEGHELSRSGKPRHRQERFEIILDWLERTLSSDGAAV